MTNSPFLPVSGELLTCVTGGQNVPPGLAGGRWSTAPNPTTGQGPLTAPGMGIRDVMQGGAVSPNGGPTGGLNTNPGGGGGGGGGFGSQQLPPLL